MPILAVAQQWDHMMNGWGWGMGLWWLIGPVLLILAVVAIWRLLQSPRSSRAEDSALEILRQRFARGEIDKNEFEEKKRDLTRE